MEEYYKNITEHLITLETSLHRRRTRTLQEMEQFAVSVKSIVDRVLLAFAAHPHANAKISKDRNFYVQSRYTVSNLSFRTTIESVLPLMVEDGWVEIIRRGSFDKETGKGKQTEIRGTKKLTDMFKEYKTELPRIMKRQPAIETIRLHNDMGRNIDYEDNDRTNLWRDNLTKINTCLLRHWSYLDLTKNEWSLLQQEAMANADHFYLPVDVSRQTLYRVFNSPNFNEGGRFYGGWWQSIPSRYRSMIILDGKQTVELDYGQLNPTMMYAKAGRTLDGDAYDIGISSDYRDIIKQAFNSMVQARRKLIQPPRKLPISITGLKWKEIAERILQRHEPIKDMFFKGIGNTLQFEDSQIAEKVMLHFVKWDAPILPVHDSFISHHGYESDLNDVMSDAFEQQYGVKAKIKLEEKKYVRLRDQDDGDDMTMESILAHFDEYGDIYGRG